MPYLYRLYGLTAESDLPLPELPAVDNGLPDTFFRYGDVPQNGLAKGKQLGPFHWAAPGKLWLHVPGIARYLVTEGSEILIDPHPGIDEDSVRIFLLSSCIGAMLMQRELLVLRGCAVGIGNECMLCLGASASGKSTLAAALMHRGHSILSDDVVAIDGKSRAIQGFPDIKLWRDDAEKLGISTASLRKTRPVLEKYHLPLDGLFQAEPLPVRWVYVLQPHNSRDFLLEDISGMERFTSLHENSFRPDYMKGMELSAGHLKMCARFSGKIMMKNLYRPGYPLQARELADFIIEDIDACNKK